MLNQYKILRVLQIINYFQKTPYKSIDQLSNFLVSFGGTVYRFLEPVREFELHKDTIQPYYTKKDEGDNIHFTNEKSRFLKQF